MFKRTICIALALALVIPAAGMAKDMFGKYGPGFYSSNAPLGGRYWLDSQKAVDAGIGLVINDGNLTFGIDFGIPYIIQQSERANFLVRPGISFVSSDNGANTSSTFDISFAPGAEVFIGDYFSIDAGVAFSISFISPGGNADSYVRFGSSARNIASLGFHFYFDKK